MTTWSLSRIRRIGTSRYTVPRAAGLPGRRLGDPAAGHARKYLVSACIRSGCRSQDRAVLADALVSTDIDFFISNRINPDAKRHRKARSAHFVEILRGDDDCVPPRYELVRHSAHRRKPWSGGLILLRPVRFHSLLCLSQAGNLAQYPAILAGAHWSAMARLCGKPGDRLLPGALHVADRDRCRNPTDGSSLDTSVHLLFFLQRGGLEYLHRDVLLSCVSGPALQLEDELVDQAVVVTVGPDPADEAVEPFFPPALRQPCRGGGRSSPSMGCST